MIPDPVRLYNPKGPDRMAVVSAEPASSKAGMYLIRIARGSKVGALGKGSVFGPYPASELEARFAEVVEGLRSVGFGPPGLATMLEPLASPDSRTRSRAAIRLGWRRSVEAVGPLLDALPGSVDDACCILDALGAIGDARAIPAVRAYATRKLLSRRRSAVEALRNLGDEEGLSEAIARARDQLPQPVRTALDAIGPQDDWTETVEVLTQAVRALDGQHQGLALDTLYEIGTPAAIATVRAVLANADFSRPYLWRYIKSVYKRTQLRHEPSMFGWLSHAIESQARKTPGTKATVKSGYDGVQRTSPIFQRKTQDFLRRLGWRYLRNLAAYRPEHYAPAAAEALVAYTPEDAEEPEGLRGEFARCYLLHRILWGGGGRFVLDDRRLTFRFRDAKSTQARHAVREESFPHLWDAQPSAYLRVLSAAPLPEAHIFAARAVAGPHRRVLEEAEPGTVLRLLRAPYEPTVNLGLAELERRFDPQRPDMALLDCLLSDELPRARELGRSWLRLSAPRWTRDQEWVLVFLAFPDAATASLSAELAADRLRGDPEMRRALAARLLARLRAPEPSPGAHDVYARVAREALADEMGALLSLPDLLAMVKSGSPPLQAMAGDLLGRRPEAVAHLGLEGLAALAGHEVAAVRAAAHSLMRGASDEFRADPAPLYLLIESDWADTRALAFDLLRHHIGLESLGPEGLMGLLDSNRPDVQDVARELVKRHFAELKPRVLVARMVEHPHPNMRRFALDLVVEHLPDHVDALIGVEWFLRAAMLDLKPDRLVKRRVIDFLLRRGLRDEYQAEVAARLLGEFARMDVRADFEHAMEALVRLNLEYPGLNSPVAVAMGGVA
jgi:HEAT repeat protein